jgi:hypothetical protein
MFKIVNTTRLFNLKNISVNKQYISKFISFPMIRSFGSSNNTPAHHDDPAMHNVLSEHHDDHHDDHGHGHHEITGEVDFEKIHVPISKNNLTYISLIGIPPKEHNSHHAFSNERKAYFDTTPIYIPLITRNRQKFRDMQSVQYEDNPYFHSEPYGYLTSDDVIFN